MYFQPVSLVPSFTAPPESRDRDRVKFSFILMAFWACFVAESYPFEKIKNEIYTSYKNSVISTESFFSLITRYSYCFILFSVFF